MVSQVDFNLTIYLSVSFFKKPSKAVVKKFDHDSTSSKQTDDGDLHHAYYGVLLTQNKAKAASATAHSMAAKIEI